MKARAEWLATDGVARRRRTLGLLFPLLGGLALRAWFVVHAPAVSGDGVLYADIARNWLEHGVYGLTHGVAGATPEPTLIRLPGYPLFLAICFRLFGVGDFAAVVWVQAAVDLLACLLLADLVRRMFTPRAGVAALWLSALCPFTATYAAAPLAETLTLACIVAAFYCLQRWQSAGAGVNEWLVGIGAALAYSILLRPEQGLLAAAAVPAMLWIGRERGGSRRLRLTRVAGPALIVSILALLPLVPWTLRNEATFDVFEPLAPRSATDPGEPIPYGFMRWYRTWGLDFASTERAYWNYDGDTIDIDDLPSRAFDSEAQREETAQLLADYNETTNPTPALDARFAAIAEQRIRAHRLRYYVELPVARLLNMLFRPRVERLNGPLEWWKFDESPLDTAVALVYGAINLGYLALGGLGFARWRRNGFAPYGALAWSMVASVGLRCGMLLTLDNSEPRYTLEFFPVLIVFAAALWSGQRRESQSG